MAKETTAHTGTGSPITLAGASSPFSTFVARATAELIGGSPWSDINYVMTDNGGNWEIGRGSLVDAASDTITRGTILYSSNGGAAVDWAAGTKDIYSWPSGDELSGSFIQHQFTISSSTFSVTTATPLEDGSTPLISEGAQIITLSWTPQRTDTHTILRWVCPYAAVAGTAPVGTATLWYGNTLVTAANTAAGSHPFVLNGILNHTATTNVTLQIRAGVTSGDTLYLNRSTSSATPYGAGNMKMVLEAFEVVT
ncbi:MAG: hypothetical protein ACYSQZ_04735 [Planctomycetota bacterium]